MGIMFVWGRGKTLEARDLLRLLVRMERNIKMEFKMRYVEIKCQLDVTEVFIADLIACSTCFGQHYAHSCGLCVRFAGCCSILQTGRITLSSTPDQLLEKPQHEIPQAATNV